MSTSYSKQFLHCPGGAGAHRAEGAADLLLRYGLASYQLAAVRIIVGAAFHWLLDGGSNNSLSLDRNRDVCGLRALALLPATAGAFDLRDAAIGVANGLILYIEAVIEDRSKLAWNPFPAYDLLNDRLEKRRCASLTQQLT